MLPLVLCVCVHFLGALFVLGQEKPTGWRHGAKFHQETVICRLINVKTERDIKNKTQQPCLMKSLSLASYLKLCTSSLKPPNYNLELFLH